MQPEYNSASRLLYLSRSDVMRAGGDQPRFYVEAVARALTHHAQRDFVQPLKPYLRWEGAGHVADRIIAMPAYLGGEHPIAGLKWIGSKHDNPTRRGRERASGLVILNDPESNYPIAVMEAGLISGMRTAAVTAVGAKCLAQEGFQRVACIGCGPIARMQLCTLIAEFSSISTVFLFDLNPAAAHRLAADLKDQFPEVDYQVAATAQAAVGKGELVVTCTVASQPYIPFEWLRRGAFVSNVSIMDFHKEVFLQVDKVVVDDWDQCNREKKVIHQLVQEGRFSRDRLHAELGEILIGRRPGRETDDEIILLNPMGMAIEDVACAQAIYERAIEMGIGSWLELA